MNALKIAVLILLFQCALLACNNDKDRVVGKYKAIVFENSYKGEVFNRTKPTFEFDSDGALRIGEKRGRWNLDQKTNKITFMTNGHEGFKVTGRYSFVDNKLKIEGQIMLNRSLDLNDHGNTYLELERRK